MEEEIDLFEYYQDLPAEVLAVLEKHETEDHTYDSCALLVEDLEKIGYTCEYGLDAQPYGLRKL